MNLKSLFIILNTINLSAVVIVILIIVEYKKAYSHMEQAYISKHRSFLLADELRQSSDDLTRLVRTYIITTEPRFKKQYYQILAIRNGLSPRPLHYNQIYWDFLAVKGSNDKDFPKGKAVALQDLMIQAGFTQEELLLLKKSQKQSDNLVHLEEKAMQTVEGRFKDKNGNYTIIKKPDLALARKLLHSDEYHLAKVKIMKPLNQFLKLLEARTDRIILEGKNAVKEVEDILDLMVTVLIIVLITSIGIMFHRIVYPLISLKKSMLLLAKNDTSVHIPQKLYNDEIGGMIEAIDIFKDNTQRLIVSEQKVKLLFDAMGEGFFGLNARGAFSFVNPVAAELLGYKSTELLKLHLYKLFHTIENSSKMSKLLLNNQGTKNTGIIELKRKDGTCFPAEYTSTPILDHSNQLEGSVVVFSDITERKMRNDALRQAKEIAETANHSKTLFLANMSHELRTPLNAILGFTQLLLKDSNLTSIQTHNITTIHESGKHLLSIISEILEVAKLQAGKIEIVSAAFDLLSFFDNIVFIFSNRAQAKNLQFTYDEYKSLPHFIICDEQRLRQVLFNLLSNAIKFTDKGSIHLSISYKNNQLFCQVRDTGPGIKEKDMNLIFKPFEQVKSSSKRYEGTGLGLAITKELILLLHGDISVMSIVNKGTTFSFNIHADETFIGEEKQEVEDINLIRDPSSINKTILVVDDIAENRSLLVQILQGLGFITAEANNGYNALEQLQNVKPDLIFMDIQMPRINGFEAIAKIRSGLYNPTIPIVLVSANIFEDTKHKALNEGANAFIEKPIKEEDIIESLKKLLDVNFLQVNATVEKFNRVPPTKTNLSNMQLEEIIKNAKVLDNEKTKQLFESYQKIDTHTITILQEHLYNYDFVSIVTLCQKLIHTEK